MLIDTHVHVWPLAGSRPVDAVARCREAAGVRRGLR
jgi:hypothetical protein